MTTPVSFTIGADVSCSDGRCGRIARVVVDPVARSVTHLVVEPAHWLGLGRLVPIELAGVSESGVRLDCTRADFDQLEPAEETHFLTATTDTGAASDTGTARDTEGAEPYPPSAVLAWPYFGLTGPGMAGGPVEGMPPVVTFDAVPPGEVEVRRGRPVHATDGAIGHVEGLVVDPRSHHVTHVLLREGHLRGRKEVAIPITAVAAVDVDGIRLSISKQDVAGLPPVDIDHPV